MPGAVRNADRIWVNTPQNRTYRTWGKLELLNQILNLHHTSPVSRREPSIGRDRDREIGEGMMACVYYFIIYKPANLAFNSSC